MISQSWVDSSSLFNYDITCFEPHLTCLTAPPHREKLPPYSLQATGKGWCVHSICRKCQAWVTIDWFGHVQRPTQASWTKDIELKCTRRGTSCTFGFNVRKVNPKWRHMCAVMYELHHCAFRSLPLFCSSQGTWRLWPCYIVHSDRGPSYSAAALALQYSVRIGIGV
jgi:hypothetical protein